jgi:hypothetical protein
MLYLFATIIAILTKGCKCNPIIVFLLLKKILETLTPEIEIGFYTALLLGV